MARSVLIVDDSAPFRATARTLLESCGYVIAGTAEDGASALDAVRRLRPDAVLLDVHLPDLDGPAVAARLLAAGDAPVIVLVSSDEHAAPEDARFLPKAQLGSARLLELLGEP